MKFNFKKEILPHIIAITVFLIVTVLFYHPLFLTNQELRGNDVIQGIASGQEAREFREATGEEIGDGLAFVRAESSGEGGEDELSPWEKYVQGLLLLNEFVFVD